MLVGWIADLLEKQFGMGGSLMLLVRIQCGEVRLVAECVLVMIYSDEICVLL